MILPKITKQNMEVLKERQPDLYKSIMLHFNEEKKNLPLEELQGWIAGFGLEILIKTKGNITSFEGGIEEVQEDDYLD